MSRDKQEELSLRLATLSEALQGIDYFISLSSSDSERLTITSLMDMVIEYNNKTQEQFNELTGV